MKRDYEYIVIGCGGIGSGAAYWLSRRAGAEVLCLEQFKIGHHHGGSQDHSRIIRLAYHDAKYTRLTPHIYEAWNTVESESDVELVLKTGGVVVAYKHSPHHRDIEKYAAAMDAADMEYERLDHDEFIYRYPQFHPQEEAEAIYQSQTGLVNSAKGIAAHVALARGYGATIIDECPVLEIRPQPDNSGVRVVTEQGSFDCRRLVVAAGAWSNRLLASVGKELPITVTQEQITYYATPHLKKFAPGRFPVFQWKGEQSIYGFPVYGEVATKAAIDASGLPVTTETRTYEADAMREKQVEDWLAIHIPDFLGPKLYTKSCLYTLLPDRDFIVDFLPEYPQVAMCIGAGHGYKFASLLGQILSELAIDGKSNYEIEPFSYKRPILEDKNATLSYRI